MAGRLMAEAKCSEHWEVFESWRSEHQKNYQCEKEMLYRFGLFSDRLKWIEEENKKNNSYKMGMNQFTDMTSEEYPLGRAYQMGSPFEIEDETTERMNPIKRGFNYVKEHGIQSEEDYANKVNMSESRLFRIAGYTSVAPDEMSFITALLKQPVCVVIAAHDSIVNYKEGIYNGPFGNKLNCCMLAVGFDHHCITLKHCWGTSWGEKGYIRIVRQLPGHPYGPGGLYSRVVYPYLHEPSKINPNESDPSEPAKVGEMVEAESSQH